MLFFLNIFQSCFSRNHQVHHALLARKLVIFKHFMLSLCTRIQFSGEEEQKLKRAVATFCSNQPSALELIKTRQKKDQKFNLFMQVSARLPLQSTTRRKVTLDETDIGRQKNIRLSFS